MIGGTDPLDLGVLDEFQAIELDPSIWHNNRQSLQRVAPAVLALIAPFESSTRLRAAKALDGSIAFKVVTEGSPSPWLSQTSIPQTRAAALLTDALASDGNIALSSVGTGHEVVCFLTAAPRHRLAFVFERDFERLAAILRAFDLSEALERGRLVFVTDDARETLQRFLDEHEGVLPPTQLVTLPETDHADIAQIKAACDRAAARTLERRTTALEALTAGNPALAPAATEAAKPRRLALISAAPSAPCSETLVAIEAAAVSLGWSALMLRAASPADMHPLAFARRMQAFGPQATLALGPIPRALRPLCGARTLEWAPSLATAPNATADAPSAWLAGSPPCAAYLRSQAPNATVIDWHWAASDAEPHAAEPVDDSIALLGPLPASTADACGVQQSTHRMLWDRVQALAAARWQMSDVEIAGELLRRAESELGIAIVDEEMRARFTRILTHVLVASVVREKLLGCIRKLDCRLLLIGAGWERIASERERVLPLATATANTGRRPVVALGVGFGDALTPELVHAAAAGWPLALYSPSGTISSANIGGMLLEKQHYEVCTSERDLRSLVERRRRAHGATQSLGDRTAAHMRRNHTWKARLRAIEPLLFMQDQGVLA